MTDQKKPDEALGAAPPSASRRRLLQAGIGASPAILTLVSNPVRATYTTTPASSFASVNTSRPGTHVVTNGCKPSYWVNCGMAQWPAACKDAAGNPKKFKDLFSDYGTYGSKTLIQCLQLGPNSGMDGVVKHVCAAYLNAASGKVPSSICSTQTAKDIWQSYSGGKGYYEPTAGVKWFADSCDPSGNGGINPWLKTTMPAG